MSIEGKNIEKQKEISIENKLNNLESPENENKLSVVLEKVEGLFSNIDEKSKQYLSVLLNNTISKDPNIIKKGDFKATFEKLESQVA